MTSEKGVSLIITLFVMIIILAVVFSVSVLLYSQIKILRDIGNSVGSFYAADSGVEKVLFYNLQALPVLSGSGTATYAPRGLCAIYPYDPVANPTGCHSSGMYNKSLYCAPDSTLNSGLPQPGNSDPTNGCDKFVCDDCTVSFGGSMDNGGAYSIMGAVSPASGDTSFDLYSKGTYKGIERQIRIFVNSPNTQEAITISGACANPKSNQQGTSIEITANVTANNSGGLIRNPVNATIQDASGNYYNSDGTKSSAPVSLPMQCGLPGWGCNYKSGSWFLDWPSGSALAMAQSYSVSITAQNEAQTATKTASYIPFYPLCTLQ